MSQFYDQASLVMVPSGYKAGKVYSQKPLSIDGELTFTRNSNATRVVMDASGQQRLEKVRTNELTQSNFATGWGLSNVTLTGGQSGYDGSSNAWLMTDTNSAAYGTIDRLVSIGAMNTTSIYAKAGTTNIVGVRPIGGSSPYVFFDLSNGTFEAYGDIADLVRYDIQGVGGGWYRCSVTSKAALTKCFFYIATTGGALAPAGSTIYIQDAQVESGDVMTDYIPTTSAAVSVGPTANVPRLDYSGGATCGKLLLEPQRTNVLPNSERMSAITSAGGTITDNATTSPDGYANADLYTEDNTNTYHRFNAGTQTYTSGQAYTFSIFAKSKSGNRYLIANCASAFNARAYFDIDNGTVTTASGTASIEDYGGGWYRCIVTGTATATKADSIYWGLNSTQADSAYTGDGTSGMYFWGCQLENSASYASSYIGPTLGASVTRLADAAYKTGISSLIGQTEGTIFLEMSPIGNTTSYTERLLKLYGGGQEIGFQRYGNDRLVSYGYLSGPSNEWTFDVAGVFTSTTQSVKIAIAYKANDIALYVNGVFKGSDSSASMFSALSQLAYAEDTAGNLLCPQGIKQTLLFKTRLTNAQLAELTTL